MPLYSTQSFRLPRNKLNRKFLEKFREDAVWLEIIPDSIAQSESYSWDCSKFARESQIDASVELEMAGKSRRLPLPDYSHFCTLICWKIFVNALCALGPTSSKISFFFCRSFISFYSVKVLFTDFLCMMKEDWNTA